MPSSQRWTFLLLRNRYKDFERTSRASYRVVAVVVVVIVVVIVVLVVVVVVIVVVAVVVVIIAAVGVEALGSSTPGI